MNKGSNLFVKEIRARIDAYFKIAVRNVRNTIPKTIGCFLVKASQERLQFELYSSINKTTSSASCSLSESREKASLGFGSTSVFIPASDLQDFRISSNT
jgi:hypothetical protein